MPAASYTADVLLRPATAEDIPTTTTITNHYIENTTANFAEELLSLEQNLASFHANTIKAGYPYLVAVQDGQLVGYAKLSPFRAGTGGGYRITAELSLFVDPSKLSLGLGALLLTNLLDVVQNPEKYEQDWIGPARRGDGRIRNVLSCMGVDPSVEGGGEGLARYYERFGFERVGRLRGVACKFGKTLDTIYLQKQFP